MMSSSLRERKPGELRPGNRKHKRHHRRRHHDKSQGASTTIEEHPIISIQPWNACPEADRQLDGDDGITFEAEAPGEAIEMHEIDSNLNDPTASLPSIPASSEPVMDLRSVSAILEDETSQEEPLLQRGVSVESGHQRGTLQRQDEVV